jgi:hypothetical protein
MEIAKENGTFFRRKEKKFLVESKTYFTLKKIFDEPKGKFKRDHLASKTEFTYIENIYLDSPDLNSYHQSIIDHSDRFKLRIRSYSQDFVRDDDRIFFEVKGKENEATVKKRVAFKFEWLDRFLVDGAYPIDDFVFLNEDKEPTKSLEIVSYISRLIRNFKYKPILSSNYLRYAYKLRGTKDIRITIDRDLKFNPLVKDLRVELPYAGVFSGNQFIFEIKYLDEEMLSKIPEIMNLLGQTCKFSKYNYGIYNSYLNKTVVEPKFERLPSNTRIGAIGHALSY